MMLCDRLGRTQQEMLKLTPEEYVEWIMYCKVLAERTKPRENKSRAYHFSPVVGN